ncbi:unnamed protein product [Parnassius apollo]|uniref:(apollo) hypothetical protein n=1 Tax=Parnassius apollo TaxID=110799 RepID=A0A8S3WFT6_PARAO|nr:unnamed protein product [Parnassius apollo]
MHLHFIFLIFRYTFLIDSKKIDTQKFIFCKNLRCDDLSNVSVCGIKEEVEGFRLKLFKNECQLLRYGCNVGNDETYGIINLEYCNKAFSNEEYEKQQINNEFTGSLYEEGTEINRTENCMNINCKLTNETRNICGLKEDGAGYKVRLFNNKCELMKHNCEENKVFVETDLFICKSVFTNSSINDKANKMEPKDMVNDTIQNLVIVNTNILDYKNDINNTIETFFAATHVKDLPIREFSPNVVNEITRRRLIKIAGPVKVFEPYTIIPKNISDDYMHSPTLQSCYHKCPEKCPDTYAPVCGEPGNIAREPTLMFQNHCFMDKAQCKMRWENKSPTAMSSAYVETMFVFCLGDQLNAMHRFLPLVKTLQRMGRLKKKGRFRYRLRNLRFLNNFLSRDPKPMG